MQDIIIRDMKPEDASSVQGLIQELAEFEKAPKDVKTDAQELRKNFEERVFSGIVASTGSGDIIGMALYFPYYSTWNGKTLYLEDFYVKPEWRNFGIGHMLFDEILNKGKKMGANLIKWQVLDWNTDAKNFYTKYKAFFVQGWENGIIDLTQKWNDVLL